MVYGRLAQLGERRVRNAEAEGSNPLPSTTIFSKNSTSSNGRLAQWKSACFTRKRSLVQSQQRPSGKYPLHKKFLHRVDHPLGETGKRGLEPLCVDLGDMPGFCKVL